MKLGLGKQFRMGMLIPFMEGTSPMASAAVFLGLFRLMKRPMYGRTINAFKGKWAILPVNK